MIHPAHARRLYCLPVEIVALDRPVQCIGLLQRPQVGEVPQVPLADRRDMDPALALGDDRFLDGEPVEAFPQNRHADGVGFPQLVELQLFGRLQWAADDVRPQPPICDIAHGLAVLLLDLEPEEIYGTESVSDRAAAKAEKKSRECRGGPNMALFSDAAMVLFYDIDGDVADHDAWHSQEHFRERLGVPGFLRASRWVSAGAPRYMVVYEVSDVGVATSAAYLERLNNPTPWTSAMMPRFRGMIRGFGRVVARQGFGFGARALAMRFHSEADHAHFIAENLMAAVRNLEGIVSALVLQPAAPPPMTREQSLRGADNPLPWVFLATGYEQTLLERLASDGLESLNASGMTGSQTSRLFELHQIADAKDAAT